MKKKNIKEINYAYKKKNPRNKKKGKQSNFAKLSIFQPNKYKFKKSCPLSSKRSSAIVNYKRYKIT